MQDPIHRKLILSGLFHVNNTTFNEIFAVKRQGYANRKLDSVMDITGQCYTLYPSDNPQALYGPSHMRKPVFAICEQQRRRSAQ